MGLLLLSFLLPLAKLSLSSPQKVEQAMTVLEDIVMLENESATISHTTALTETSHLWIIALIITYILGMLFCFSRQLLSYFRMFKLIGNSRVENKQIDFTLLVHNKQIAPFSWMKYIIISENDLEENGKEILTHELAHIHKKHSWDLIVADICIIFQWFNPATWLLKQELQSIHEFEADDVVLNEGIDAKKYQLLLIKKAVGTRLYSMANSFNHSSLKKRITMMLKEKSNPWARLKYLYVLPLASFTMLAFARPDVTHVENISAEKVNDIIASAQTEKIPHAVQTHDKFNEISVKNKSGEVKIEESLISNNDNELLAQNTAPSALPVKTTVKFKAASPPSPSSPELKSTNATKPETSATEIKGKVVNSSDNQPISSVFVAEVDPSNRILVCTITKDDGTFQLQVKNRDNKIKFSHVSYQTKVSPVTEINNIQMEEKTLALEETVVVTYGGTTEKQEDVQSNNDQKVVLVEKMPQFPGGDEALMKYILGSLKYPISAKSNKIEGKVVCSYVVNSAGRVTDVKVISSVDPELDKEAKRVVENMPDWIPGKQNEKNVSMKYTIPINFKIAK